MSVRLEAANSEYLQIASIGTAGAQTWYCRFYLVGLPGAGIVAAVLSLFTADFTGFQVHVDENGKLSIDGYDSGDAGPGTAVLGVGWHALWITVSGTGNGTVVVNVYVDGGTTADVATGTMNITAAAEKLTLGSYQGGGDYLNGRLRRVDGWTGVRSPTTNFAASIASCGAPDTVTNIIASWPLAVHTDLTDAIGSLDLTATGTLSTEADPPECAVVGYIPPAPYHRAQHQTMVAM